MRRWAGPAVMIVAGLLVGLALSELVASLLYPRPQQFYVRRPNLRRTFSPLEDVMPGVRGPTRFITNSLGIRGDEFAESQQYRILAVGGSTTECVYLDQDRAWPSLIQRILVEATGLRVWVGNVGVSGHTTRDHIVYLKYLLPQYPRIDAVVVLAGINDFSLRTSHADYDPLYLKRPGAEREVMRKAFYVLPSRFEGAIYRKTALWNLGRQIQLYFSGPRQDRRGEVYRTWRSDRQQATLVDQLPDLEPGLDEFRRNLTTLVDLAATRGVRLIFLTQPFLWRDDLTVRETDLLIMGRAASKPGEEERRYYTVRALQEGMSRYNQATLEVCRARGVECIDLAARVPRTLDAFFDDVHFNDGGAKLVAQIVSNSLRQGILGAEQPTGKP
ncbi:MAG: SGNH/GDSL hydrolase family protein [Candidatus Methylomirabilales bacterium]